MKRVISILVIVVTMILLGALSVGCGSAHASVRDGEEKKAEVINGCDYLQGRDRLECHQSLFRLCMEAKNPDIEHELLSTSRDGPMAAYTYQVCIVGKSGYRFSCFKYVRTQYDPTFASRLIDYSIPGGIGVVIGILIML